SLALAQLLMSHLPVPVGFSLAVFVLSALLEGAITVAVVGAIETINPKFMRQPGPRGSFALGAVAAAAVLLAVLGVLFASTQPDWIEKLAHGKSLINSPLANYEADFFSTPWLRKATGGLAGLALILGACVIFG